ncbi:radical SAM/SPASM domain-containing protein [Actinosynnema sp. ALI-1.44]|uniref:radical SAM/SPASM domain-containing protein n=1 Tax=Actinosynnema sp. ALI-1.44 TaxID=1933779 RepID=UPI001ED9E205|nr:radical SAM/SPASM domain-containing protein [Actinosynnema sp. ALI-1.44]
MWLEITGTCQLTCTHCYADSGPSGTTGAMTVQDWARVIDQAAGLGVGMVQFIGGEPTLHPGLPDLIARVLRHGIRVEVFTNLVHVSPRMWEVFAQPGVQLATSYYTDQAEQHEAITRGRGSYGRTKANIATAVRRSIPLRVGVIDVHDGQRIEQARDELTALGVRGEVRVDHLRGVGRGAGRRRPDVDQLCGQCARDKVAVSPTGEVWPCVFSRWLPVGNVRRDTLADILTGASMAETTENLARRFAGRVRAACDPQCGPNCGPACHPSCWPTGAGPCGPNGGCQPNYD